MHYVTEKEFEKFLKVYKTCEFLNYSSFNCCSKERFYEIARGRVKMTEQEFIDFKKECFDLKNLYQRMHVGTLQSQVRAASLFLNDPRLRPYKFTSLLSLKKWDIEQVINGEIKNDNEAKTILKKLSSSASKKFQSFANLI